MNGQKKIKGGKAMKSLRNLTLEKVLNYMDYEDLKALYKGLKAFLDISKSNNNNKVLNSLKKLLEEGVISQEEFSKYKKKIDSGFLNTEEAKSIAWLRSQAMLIFKAAQEIISNKKQTSKAS